LHGANRLGGNSLSDLLVFGKRAGEYAAKYAKENPAGKDQRRASRGSRARGASNRLNAANAGGSAEGPYQVQHDLQNMMQETRRHRAPRRRNGIRARRHRQTQGTRRERSAVHGHREYNPGWHTALDLKHLLTISEAITRRRSTARKAAAAISARIFRTRIPKRSQDEHRHFQGRRMVPCNCAANRFRDAGRTETSHRGDEMNKTVTFRIWRTDANGGGKLVDYTTEITEGMVVLDVVHKIQATQANDLACRWNCKAGKCGSCSAEVNGMPEAHVHDAHGHDPDRQAGHHRADARVSEHPRSGHRCLVEFRVKKKIKPFKPRAPDAPDGTWRMQQEDVDRVQEFRKCIECFLCQDVCHVLRDHHKHEEFIGPRFLVYTAALEMHPLDTEDRMPELKQAHGIGFCNITKCCTKVCPENITITDNAIIPLKERVVDEFYDPLGWLWKKAHSTRKLHLGKSTVATVPPRATVRLAAMGSDANRPSVFNKARSLAAST
jgi:succinate dehydrogenase / fumarate reductase iron-sulfur subunit